MEFVLHSNGDWHRMARIYLNDDDDRHQKNLKHRKKETETIFENSRRELEDGFDVNGIF